jgi:hypothetical protein
VPQLLPIAFELAYRDLGESDFIEALKTHLYSEAEFPSKKPEFRQSDETLAVIARLLVQEHKREGRRRIDAVITLNVDDLIEQAVNHIAGFDHPPPSDGEIVRVVGRGTHSQVESRNRPIPVYHIHGFVPSEQTDVYLRRFYHTLVFTDAQYWSTSATALSFANRVMASALGESHCVFIGLSMTDINLLRWLGLRTLEKDRDLFEVSRIVEGKELSESTVNDGFRRHFWIRPKKDDPTGLLSEFLRLRGVDSVEIDGWPGKSFRTLVEKHFPEETTD